MFNKTEFNKTEFTKKVVAVKTQGFSDIILLNKKRKIHKYG